MLWVKNQTKKSHVVPTYGITHSKSLTRPSKTKGHLPYKIGEI